MKGGKGAPGNPRECPGQGNVHTPLHTIVDLLQSNPRQKLTRAHSHPHGNHGER